MTIAGVIRQAWSRLVRKQWLLLYPLAVWIFNTLAFFAIYMAIGAAVRLSPFFNASFSRGTFLYDNLFADFSLNQALAFAIGTGVVLCAIQAFIRAAYFRAIAGPGYPLQPNKWKDAGSLFLFYVLYALVTSVVALASPTSGVIAQLIVVFILIVSILMAFTDYVIIYESRGLLSSLRRGLRLVTHRWLLVVLTVIGLQLLMEIVHLVYSLFYSDTGKVFILLPISEALVTSLVVLFSDLVLIFLYEDIRRRVPLN